MHCTITSGFEDATAPRAGAFIPMRRIPAYISRISLWTLGGNMRVNMIDLPLRTASSKSACLVSFSNLRSPDIFSMRTEPKEFRRSMKGNDELVV